MAGRNHLLAGDGIEVHEIEENGSDQTEADEDQPADPTPPRHQALCWQRACHVLMLL